MTEKHLVKPNPNSPLTPQKSNNNHHPNPGNPAAKDVVNAAPVSPKISSDEQPVVVTGNNNQNGYGYYDEYRQNAEYPRVTPGAVLPSAGAAGALGAFPQAMFDQHAAIMAHYGAQYDAHGAHNAVHAGAKSPGSFYHPWMKNYGGK